MDEYIDPEVSGTIKKGSQCIFNPLSAHEIPYFNYDIRINKIKFSGFYVKIHEQETEIIFEDDISILKAIWQLIKGNSIRIKK